MSAPQLFDTHCHIHEAVERLTPVYDKWHEKGPVDPDKMIADARAVGVAYLLCVGTTRADSELAIEFAAQRENIWATIGIHPHEASDHMSANERNKFRALASRPEVVAVGECGLDYYYSHSPKSDQLAMLEFQIELALEHNLPLSFHVRDAFDDFWPVFERYKGIRGVLHSFTDNLANLERALGHGLYIGVNGIATFARDEEKRVIYRTIPQHSLLLETDAPFLTPVPYRGTICEPRHLAVTAEFVAKLRDEQLEQMTAATSVNAISLFNTKIRKQQNL
jgi:TatD DNase family protein